MKWEEIQHHLEPDNIGNAPTAIKMGVFVTLFVIIVAAGIYFDTQEQLRVLENHEVEEVQLKDNFRVKAERAAKLELYKEQLAEMEASFGALLRQLPETTEVESLLVDVSQTGLAAGLEIKRFRPSGEEKKASMPNYPSRYKCPAHFISWLRLSVVSQPCPASLPSAK